ncbi:MAG TPA: PQQ-binding-like beta-propeller repeat protein, partial [Planctomycetaceae bacterium]|nr:PQQ-binding-like beta-propeller repeat protein [Planctomycetaceae bacterium]
DPLTGKFHWFAEIPSSDQANASVVAVEGVAYSLSGGRGGGGSSAVKVGGKDEVTDSNIVWKGRASGRFGTPVLHEGRIYSISSTLASCMDAKTGEIIYEERISTPRSAQQENQGRRGGFGGSDYSSPVIAGDKLYYVQGSGETIVLKTGDNFEQVGTNQTTSENESFMATPAISDGAIFIRSSKTLYCIGE